MQDHEPCSEKIQTRITANKTGINHDKTTRLHQNFYTLLTLKYKVKRSTRIQKSHLYDYIP